MPTAVGVEWAGDAAAFQKSQASQVVLLLSALLFKQSSVVAVEFNEATIEAVNERSQAACWRYR